MDNQQLIASFEAFGATKNIDKPTMIRMLDDVLRTLIQKKFGDDSNFDIVINPNKGDLQIWRSREIVDDNSEDIWDKDKISLSEAQKIEPDFEVGEEVGEEVSLDVFGRRAVIQALQLLIQKRRALEASQLYEKYKNLVGQMVNLEAYQVLRKTVFLYDDNKNELVLPKTEQIPGEEFRQGQYVCAIIDKVKLEKNKIEIILSRTSTLFLEKLLESEIPEIFDGLITIEKIVRRPGERSKVAVATYDDRIDPVGACVGVKGARIHSIMRQIGNEQIDIINYTENLDLYIARALSPAKVRGVKQHKNHVAIHLKPDQIAIAIGTRGQNITLASELVGRTLKVYKELEDDVHIEEFSDEIDTSIIDQMKEIELDTAKRILETSKEELEEKTGLDIVTIEAIYKTLEKEFKK